MGSNEDREFLRDAGVSTWNVSFSEGYEDTDRVPVPFDAANAVGSALDSELGFEHVQHALLLDLDRHLIRLIPSSTPGHYHLAIAGQFLWRDVTKLLNLLAEMGIVEQGYAALSIERGQTFLRMPGEKKRPRGAAQYKPDNEEPF